MSISNLITSDINSITIEYQANGAITGSGTMNLKRLDNIVYCSIGPITGTANNTISNIVITPSVLVPNQYRPLAHHTQVTSVLNNGNAAVSLAAVQTNLTNVNFVLQTGNYNGTSGLEEVMLIWRVNNI